MKGLLQDKIALVTGGSRGIGFAISKAFVREGAKVMICARNEESLREAAIGLKPYGEVEPFVSDVSKLESISQMLEQIIDRYGKIDILVNNAGVGMTYGRVGEVDPISWTEVIHVNLIGTFHCCHAVLPYMLLRGGGRIINLKGYGASFPSPRATAYGASKAGIVALTRSVAREYCGSGIYVNLLSPGVVKTGLLSNRGTTAEGAAYLKKAESLIDLLAVDADVVGALALKVASNQVGNVTGKEFRVLSKTKLAFGLFRFGFNRFVEGRT